MKEKQEEIMFEVYIRKAPTSELLPHFLALKKQITPETAKNMMNDIILQAEKKGVYILERPEWYHWGTIVNELLFESNRRMLEVIENQNNGGEQINFDVLEINKLTKKLGELKERNRLITEERDLYFNQLQNKISELTNTVSKNEYEVLEFKTTQYMKASEYRQDKIRQLNDVIALQDKKILELTKPAQTPQKEVAFEHHAITIPKENTKMGKVKRYAGKNNLRNLKDRANNQLRKNGRFCKLQNDESI